MGGYAEKFMVREIDIRAAIKHLFPSSEQGAIVYEYQRFYEWSPDLVYVPKDSFDSKLIGKAAEMFHVKYLGTQSYPYN